MVPGCFDRRANGVRCLLVAVALIALALTGCRHDKGREMVDDPRRASLDSALTLVTNLDSLEKMAQQFHQQNDALGEMIVLKQQGRVLRNLARFEEASRVLEKKLDIATSLADTLEMSEALNNLGITNRRIGNMSVANGYHYQSLKLLDAYSGHDGRNFLRVKALTLNGIGNIEIELYDFTVADSVLHGALECERRLDNMEGLAINCCDLGKAKREMGEYDSAGYYLRKAMEYSRLCGYEKGVARSHLGLGELNEKQQLISYAVEEYKQAYDIFKAIDDSWHWQQTCLALARASLLLDEREDAHHYLHEAEVEAERTGSKVHQAEASMIHYELSLLKGDTHEALEHYVRGNNLYDSIFGKEKNEEMRIQRVDYENGVKSGEMDVLNRDINNLKRQQSMQLWFSLLLLAMAAAVIFALAYVMRERQRTQRIMKQIEETRSLFFTNVVHRLRTPLTAIMGAVDDIIGDAGTAGHDDAEGRSLQENAHLIESQSKNLLELMDRILEVGSVRSTITELDWRTGDAVVYLRMLLDTYRDQCVERHIELTYAPRESSVTIDTVPRYLNTIVNSLIENAFNYSRDFSQIMVSTQLEDDFLVIRVADTGMGISPCDLPHVFEPFYRGASAEQLMEGVGIGLTVARDMVMALGGTIDVDSVVEKGSVFTVKLPRRYKSKGFKGRLAKMMPPSQPLIDKAQRHEKLPVAADDTPSTVDKPVVLVVEDNADVARLVGLVLSKEYAVRYAQDGQQGLTLAEAHVPDLIVTDVKMPLMDGYEFTERIRASARLHHVPIIILSARTSDEARLRGVQAGANAYLVKPFISAELLAWARNLIMQHDEMKKAMANRHGDDAVVPMEAPQTADSQDDDGFLKDFAMAVEDQLSCCEKLDLDKIALTFRMGESQLRRKINDLTGKSITAHITQLRMEKALRLLRQDPDMLIGDVAVQCGFADVAYFSRVFRSHYGKTPTQARSDMNGCTND